MKILNTKLDGIKLISLNKFGDNRGEFFESFNENRYKNFDLDLNYPQDNFSTSKKNVLRGLHFRRSNPQKQIVTVLRGKIFDVVVDLRINSKTFGKWLSFELSDKTVSQIYMDKGFAHGFCVLSEFADLHYKVSEVYDANDDFGIIWDDKDLLINWPCRNPILSEKDKKYPSFKEIKFI
tara:strand:- start:878 stop:1414 length:537 start_codon:yes stop_codon:yes gene_type:complete